MKVDGVRLALEPLADGGWRGCVGSCRGIRAELNEAYCSQVTDAARGNEHNGVHLWS